MPQLPSGVIQQFLHPPLGVMTTETIPGLYTGNGIQNRPRGPINIDAFGVQVNLAIVPAGLGYTLGAVRVYEDRLCQLAVIHNLLNGTPVVSETFEIFTDGQICLWKEALPSELLFSILPGVYVSFAWLLAL